VSFQGALPKGGTVKTDMTRLQRAFNPRCVAVVGDSSRTNFEWIRGQLSFTGKLFSVHINPETAKEIEALGVQNYTRLTDIPDPVDLAIVAVNRNIALSALEDCIRKEVAAAHFFTSGFSETHTKEGRDLERQLKEKAESSDFHLIGPNCMGIFNPKIGIKQTPDQYTGEPGPVGFVAQSGAISIMFSMEAHFQGLNIAKSVSSGNSIVLDAADYLAYLGDDPEVKVIGMYLEGVGNGRKFFETLKNISWKKPVVIWKGGRSEDGDRAISSHTGAMAVSHTIWHKMLQQCGAIPVASMHQLIDTLKVLHFLPPVTGDRTAVIGGSGGQSVAITDALGDVGFRVPPLSQKSYDELASFFNVVGGSYRNPIDTAGPVRRDMHRITQIVTQDENIDNIVLVCSTKPGRQIAPPQLQASLELARHVRDLTAKPLMVFVFVFTSDADREKREVISRYQEMGIPAFPTIERGVIALKNALDYNRFHTRQIQ